MKVRIDDFIKEATELRESDEKSLERATELLQALKGWERKNLDKNFFAENFTTTIDRGDGQHHTYIKYDIVRIVRQTFGNRYHIYLDRNEKIVTHTRETAEVVEAVEEVIERLTHSIARHEEDIKRAQSLDAEAIEEGLKTLVEEHSIPTRLLREVFEWAKYRL